MQMHVDKDIRFTRAIVWFRLDKEDWGEKSFAMQTRPDSKDMQSNFKMHTGIRAASLRTTIHSLFFHKKGSKEKIIIS